MRGFYFDGPYLYIMYHIRHKYKRCAAIVPCRASRSECPEVSSELLQAKREHQLWTHTMSRRRKPGRTLGAVQRLQQRVAEGDFYEALQLYKTSYSRFKAQGKLDDAEELLTTGAISMAKEKEASCLHACARLYQVSLATLFYLAVIMYSDPRR